MAFETFTAAMGRFIVAPPDTSLHLLDRVKVHFIETVGVALSGTRERSVRAALACAPSVAEPSQSARCLVSSRRMSLRDAAACNGAAAHAHDFDDDEPHVIVGHPSVAVVSALMALADSSPVSFEAALRAYLVGTEAMLRLGSLVNPQHYNAGWHCTASLGVVGAAAACARAMRLTAGETCNALSIAVTFASGLKENFGSDGKPLQVGAAAANAVWACQLALAGLQGAGSAITGKQGFVAMNRGQMELCDAESWGRPWAVESPGFNVKIYPCCSSTHTALDAILELVGETGWGFEQIENIDVWVGSDVPKILIHDIPETGLEGKFSMRYCLSYAAVHGGIGFNAFTDDAIYDGRVAAMIQRTRIHIDEDLPRAATGVTHRSRVQLTSKEGKRAQRSHGAPRGSAERPCSADQLRNKFIACASHGLSPRTAQRVWARVESLSLDDPISRLLDAIHQEPLA